MSWYEEPEETKMIVCPYCDGKGVVDEEKCDRCEGEGEVVYDGSELYDKE